MFSGYRQVPHQLYYDYPSQRVNQRSIAHIVSTPKRRKLEITQKSPYTSKYPFISDQNSRLLVSERLNNQSYIRPQITKQQPRKISRSPQNLQRKMSQLTSCKSATNLTQVDTYNNDNNYITDNRERRNSILSRSNVVVPRNCYTSLPRQQFIGTNSRIFIEVNDSIKTSRPQDMHRFILEQQGIRIRPDAEFKKMSPTFLYQYAARNQQTKSNPIGYVQDGVHRNFSNMNDMGSSYLDSNRSFLGTQNYNPITSDRKFAFETSNQLYESSIFRGEVYMDKKNSMRNFQQKETEESGQKLSPAPFMQIENSIPTINQFSRNPQSSNFLSSVLQTRPFKTQPYQ